MSSSKKFTCKRTFRQVFTCLRPGQNPIPPPPPPFTLYTCIQYTYSHREGGRVEPERRGEGQQFTKLGGKYQHDYLYLQSINSDKRLLQSPLTGEICLDDDILFWCLHN
jgi:hypothetical protein